MPAIKNTILKHYTMLDISKKLGVSYQTVVNWFNPKHPSSMPVKHLETLGFVVHSKNMLGKTLNELLTLAHPEEGVTHE